MRKLFGVLAIGVFFVAGQASAVALSAASYQFQLGTLAPATIAGVGATGTATSNLSASLDAGTAIQGVFTTTVPTSAAAPITVVQVAITKNDGNTFTGTAPGNVGGDLLFYGTANVFGGSTKTATSGSGCNTSQFFPPTLPCTNATPILAVPLQVGAPNTQFAKGALVNVTAIGAGWTAGTAAVTGVKTTTPSNATNASGTATLMGANTLTVNGGGTLVLVSPTKIVTSAAGTFAAFSTLTLSYVPEPGTLLLFGTAIASLMVLGRRRI